MIGIILAIVFVILLIVALIKLAQGPIDHIAAAAAVGVFVALANMACQLIAGAHGLWNP